MPKLLISPVELLILMGERHGRMLWQLPVVITYSNRNSDSRGKRAWNIYNGYDGVRAISREVVEKLPAQLSAARNEGISV
jgi:hypothetical protein